MFKLKDSILKSSQEEYSNMDIATYTVLCALYENVGVRPIYVDVKQMARLLFNTSSPTTSNKNIVRKSLAKLGMPDEMINYDLFVGQSDYYTKIYEEDLMKVLREGGSSKLRFSLLRTYLGIMSTFDSKQGKKIGYLSISGMSQILGIGAVTLNKHIKYLKDAKVLYYKKRRGFASNVYSRWEDQELADEYVSTHSGVNDEAKERAGSIKELREISGLSQAKFAEKYHIKLGTLQKWEQGFYETPEHVLYALSCLIGVGSNETLPSSEETYEYANMNEEEYEDISYHDFSDLF